MSNSRSRSLKRGLVIQGISSISKHHKATGNVVSIFYKEIGFQIASEMLDEERKPVLLIECKEKSIIFSDFQFDIFV